MEIRGYREQVLRFSLDAEGNPGWGFHRVTPREEEVLAGFARDARRRVAREQVVVLRFDGRCPWSAARPWMQRVEEGEIEMRLRFMKGDYGISNETELRLPARRGDTPAVSVALADVPDHLGTVRGRVVTLTSPDTATVNDVWQAALAIMDAGATGIDFE